MMALHRILQQPAKTQQAGRGNGGSRSIQQPAALGRRVEIPRRDAVAVGMGNEIVGARFGGFEETGIAAVLVGQTETVQRPAQSARPARVAAVALLRALPQKLAGLDIENAFLRRGAVPTDQNSAGGQAMTQ